MKKNIYKAQGNIHIVSDEKIIDGDWVFGLFLNKYLIIKYKEGTSFPKDTPYTILKNMFKKIILTTDETLIEDGVQAIDKEFLEWLDKNPNCEFVEVKHKAVIQYGNMTMYDHNGDGSHYFCTNCEVETSRSKEELLKFGVEYYKIIIPQEEPKKETTIEEAAEKLYPVVIRPILDVYDDGIKNQIGEEDINEYCREAFIDGAKWQAERMYSEEEAYHILCEHTADLFKGCKLTLTEWFEQFKKK